MPLVVPCFNQLTYLRNIVNWYGYYSDDEVWVVDNASDYEPLLNWYGQIGSDPKIHVIRCAENKPIENLATVLERIRTQFDFYAISDPDIMPHPAVPQDFVSLLQECVERHGYHHAGLALKIDDLPPFFEQREQVQQHEGQFWKSRVEIVIEGAKYIGYHAPIDTTFAVYDAAKGWEAPMRQAWWDSSIRMFEAFHLGWYLDPTNLNSEMVHYFTSARRAQPGEPSALRNNYRPSTITDATATVR